MISNGNGVNGGANGSMGLVPVGIDLGYGYVKAVGPGGEFRFPAVTAKMKRSLGLTDIDLSGNAETDTRPKPTDSFRVRLSGPDIQGRFTVGSLARFEGGVGIPFEEDRRNHEGTKVQLAVAAALASGGSNAPLAVVTGLPPKDLDLQVEGGQTLREAMEKSLPGFQADIEFQGGPISGVVSVRIAAAKVYPQAVGGVFHALNMAGRTLGMVGDGEIGVVDIGHRTTDYMILQLQTLDIAEGLSGSLEIGAHMVADGVAESYHAATGGELSLVTAEGIVVSGNAQYPWRGKVVDLSDALVTARNRAATAIYEGLRGAWRGRMDTLRQILVMGGGGMLLGPILAERTEGFFRVVPEPQMANAKGFIAVAKRLAEGR